MHQAELSRQLTTLIADVSGAFRELGVSDWTRTRGATALGDNAWTRLEILGHLIDSAANNHQRFVRAIAEGDLVWPGYDQQAMVRAQQFGRASPPLLIALWESYNLFLARLISLIPDARLAAQCRIGDAGPVTLECLAIDYVVHLQNHLRQIFEGMNFELRWVEFT